MPEARQGDDRRIALTIVGGFLGSGKTTLLNHLLHNDEGRRFAVVVNDFGDINIDARLVVAVEGETVALSNGCICCAIRDDLVSEVLRLCQRPIPPEHIIIESSGVSRPLAIVESFFRPEIRQHVRVQTILTLLDAHQVMDEAATYADIAYAQIAVADIVVINKADLVSPEQLAVVRGQVERIVPRARILETSFGRIALALLFDHDFSPAAADRSGDGVKKHDHGHNHAHAEEFAAWSYRDQNKAFPFSAIQRMAELLPRGIYRAKGIVRLALSSNDYGVFQMTGRRSSLRLRPLDGPPPVTELIFIGHPGTTTEHDLHTLIEDAWNAANDPDAAPYLVTDLRAFQVEFL